MGEVSQTVQGWASVLLLAATGIMLSCTHIVPPLPPTPLPRATATPAQHPQQAHPTPSPTPLPAGEPITSGVSTTPPTPTPTTIQRRELQTQMPVSPNLDRYALAQRLGLISGQAIPVVPSQHPLEYPVGREDTFQLVDLGEPQVYTVEAELQVISQHAYWYMEKGIDSSINQLRGAAMMFEEIIRPTLMRYFGDVWNPGVDGNTRVTILHTRLRGASGYYSSTDGYPTTIYPTSNERKLIYLDAEALEVGSPGYYSVLTHELQHALHWEQDPGEEGWVDEGLSEVASFLLGYLPALVFFYQEQPQTQLNVWAEPLENSLYHYSSSYLFFLYLATHYGGYDNLQHLVSQPAHGIPGIDNYLKHLGYAKTFQDVFKDWVVANLVLMEEGRYSYPIEPFRITPRVTLVNDASKTDTSPQFSAQYIAVRSDEETARITFSGATTVTLLPADPYNGTHCWWGNRGDSTNSRINREVNLSSVEKATLTFRVWYDIEQDWDHAYVVVSQNGGETWDILEGRHTTSRNPVGTSFGPAFTGKSSGWLEEEVSLSPYAGDRVLVGFEYVTDDVFSGNGICIDDLAIPEIGYFDDAEEPGEWKAEGFARITNLLRQEFIVQLVGLQGDQIVFVDELVLDEENQGSLMVEGFGTTIDTVVAIIAPVTPVTRQPNSYTLSVGPPNR